MRILSLFAAILCVAGCTTTYPRPQFNFAQAEEAAADGFEFRQSAWVTGLASNGQIDIAPAGVAEDPATLAPLVDVVRSNYQSAGWGTQVAYQSIPVEIETAEIPDDAAYVVFTPFDQPQALWQRSVDPGGSGNVTYAWQWIDGPMAGSIGFFQQLGFGNSRFVKWELAFQAAPDTDLNVIFEDQWNAFRSYYQMEPQFPDRDMAASANDALSFFTRMVSDGNVTKEEAREFERLFGN